MKTMLFVLIVASLVAVDSSRKTIPNKDYQDKVNDYSMKLKAKVEEYQEQSQAETERGCTQRVGTFPKAKTGNEEEFEAATEKREEFQVAFEKADKLERELKEEREALTKAGEGEKEKIERTIKQKEKELDVARNGVAVLVGFRYFIEEEKTPSSDVPQSAPSMMIAAFVVIAFLMN